MDFQCLDKESENLLSSLLKKDSIFYENISGTAIAYLVNQGYVEGKSCRTLSDKEPRYVLSGITQKGKTYFELKNKYRKKEKQLSHRKWKIAIITTLIGAIIGLVPCIIELIKK